MENVVEMDFNELSKQLIEYRRNFMAEDSRMAKKMLMKIEELIEITETLKTTDNLDDIILVGSLVDLKIIDEESCTEYMSYNLGLEWAENTISIFSPLGSAIYGKNVGDTINYSVNGNEMEATILNKNVIEEKFPENLTVSNSVSDIKTKAKVRN